MNAPRALPTWSGPVGLADTNSTLTERGPDRRHSPPGARVGQDPGDRSPRAPRRRAACSGSRAPRHRPRRPESKPVRRSLRDELGREGRRDGRRRHAVWPRQSHREVAREVAVDRIRRAFDLDGRRHGILRPGRECARSDGTLPRPGDRVTDEIADRGRPVTFTDRHPAMVAGRDDAPSQAAIDGRVRRGAVTHRMGAVLRWQMGGQRYGRVPWIRRHTYWTTGSTSAHHSAVFITRSR